MTLEEYNEGYGQHGYAVLGKTVDEILSHEDPELSDHIYDAICQRILDKDFESLTETEHQLRAVYLLSSLVGNGGFSMYFSNSDDDAWVTALAGLKEMGADDMAAVLERTLAVFPRGMPPKGPGECELELGQLETESLVILDECSQRFCELERDLGINKLAVAYARKRKADIILP